MSTAVNARPRAKEAGPELLALQRWEEFCGWFLEHTGRWPKALRFTLTQRLENHALDVLEELVQARYQPRGRLGRLQAINLVLERMRFLLRLAHGRASVPKRAFERACSSIDEVGRMLHGWRQTLGERSKESAS